MTAAAVLIAIVLIVALGVFLARGRRSAKQDELRQEADQHRRLATVVDTEAQRKLAEADERAARAKQEQLAAEQARLDALSHQAEADDLRSHAQSIDPDAIDEEPLTADPAAGDATSRESAS